jgi:hypothetical protein
MPPLLGVGTVAHPQQRFLQSSLEWLCDSRRKPGCGLWGICVARGIRACVAPWREAGSSRAAPGSALPVSPAAARLRRPQDAVARHGARSTLLIGILTPQHPVAAAVFVCNDAGTGPAPIYHQYGGDILCVNAEPRTGDAGFPHPNAIDLSPTKPPASSTRLWDSAFMP